jgi:cytochrome c biogenesis protein ResB
MWRSKVMLIPLSVMFAIVLLGLLRYKPWQRTQDWADSALENSGSQLRVGFLPVT